MIKLDYNKMEHLELIIVISECQEELSKRGTLTECFERKFPKYKNHHTLLKDILTKRKIK